MNQMNEPNEHIKLICGGISVPRIGKIK